MKKEHFAKLMQSVKEAGEIKQKKRKAKRVFRYAVPNVKDIRKKLHASQADFASMIGVSARTLQNWEQGRRTPEGPARALLIVARKNPKAVLQALHM